MLRMLRLLFYSTLSENDLRHLYLRIIGWITDIIAFNFSDNEIKKLCRHIPVLCKVITLRIIALEKLRWNGRGGKRNKVFKITKL